MCRASDDGSRMKRCRAGVRRAQRRRHAQTRASPFHAAMPSATSESAAARARTGSSGQPAAAASSGSSTAPARPERVDQPAATLAVRALEPRLRGADAGGADRGIGSRAPGERPRAPRRDRARVAAPRDRARAHRGAEVEHRLVPAPPLPRRHRRVGRALRVGAPERRRPRSRASTRAALVSSTPTSRSWANASTARAVYGPMPGSGEQTVEVVGEAPVELLGDHRRRTGAGSPPGGCSRARPTR